jgi:hypothetical protein
MSNDEGTKCAERATAETHCRFALAHVLGLVGQSICTEHTQAKETQSRAAVYVQHTSPGDTQASITLPEPNVFQWKIHSIKGQASH